MSLSHPSESQNWISVLKDGPRKDEVFSAKLQTILQAAGKDFSGLPRTMRSATYLDTAWDVDAILPGAHEAKLIKSNGAATLTETFSFETEFGLDALLQRIKASLPDDYVYNLDYDSASHTYDYTFMVSPNSRIRHIGFPNYFHLTGDLETVFLFLGHSPPWLTNPR